MQRTVTSITYENKDAEYALFTKFNSILALKKFQPYSTRTKKSR